MLFYVLLGFACLLESQVLGQITPATCAPKPDNVSNGLAMGPALNGYCVGGMTCYTDNNKMTCYLNEFGNCPLRPASVSREAAISPYQTGNLQMNCPTGSTCYISDGVKQCFLLSSSCEDFDGSDLCSIWKSNGYCDSSASQQEKLRHCRKTCGLCNLTPTCLDPNPKDCNAWAANDFCRSMFWTSSEKAQYCPSSCNRCL
ncbi:unnamed protein product, partial [Mesorhabditis belari]|uniref:ShKT domain-containing protein n=1 Tax=Mesorhabditis belari TaxID=2138241 RepID=A0AAF3EQ42_9BILA